MADEGRSAAKFVDEGLRYVTNNGDLHARLDPELVEQALGLTQFLGRAIRVLTQLEHRSATPESHGQTAGVRVHATNGHEGNLQPDAAPEEKVVGLE